MISITFVRAIKSLQAKMGGQALGSTQGREPQLDARHHQCCISLLRAGAPEEEEQGRAGSWCWLLQKHTAVLGGAALLPWADQALHKPLVMAQEGREYLSVQFEADGRRWLTKGIHGASHCASLPPTNRSAANCLCS